MARDQLASSFISCSTGSRGEYDYDDEHDDDVDDYGEDDDTTVKGAGG